MTAFGEKRQLDRERPWEGVIAHIGVPTVDGRVLDSLHWALPLPVVCLVDHSGIPAVVGMIRVVEIRDEHDVWASGVLNDDRVDSGSHTLGIEVTEVDFTPTAEGQHLDGRLRTVRLYSGSTLKPAWSDVKIEVQR